MIFILSSLKSAMSSIFLLNFKTKKQRLKISAETTTCCGQLNLFLLLTTFRYQNCTLRSKFQPVLTLGIPCMRRTSTYFVSSVTASTCVVWGILMVWRQGVSLVERYFLKNHSLYHCSNVHEWLVCQFVKANLNFL